MLLQNHKCIYQKEFKCVKKQNFPFTIQLCVSSLHPQKLCTVYTLVTLAYVVALICSACFQCMFCVPNFFETQGLVYGSEGGMEYFVRAHPHISFYNPVAAKVGQVTFDQSTPDSKLTLQLCCYGQTRNYLLTKNNQVNSLSRK